LQNPIQMMDTDVKKRIVKLLDKVNADGNPADHTSFEKVASFLNSRFVVTVFVAGVLTTLTLFLESHIDNQIRERNRELEMLKRKQLVLAEFAQDLNSSLHYSHGMRKREIWIRAWQKEESKIPYPDELSYKETAALYEQQRSKFGAMRHPVATCLEAKAVFLGDDVSEELDRLIVLFDKYLKTHDYNEFLQAYEEIGKKKKTWFVAERDV